MCSSNFENTLKTTLMKKKKTFNLRDFVSKDIEKKTKKVALGVALIGAMTSCSDNDETTYADASADSYDTGAYDTGTYQDSYDVGAYDLSDADTSSAADGGAFK